MKNESIRTGVEFDLPLIATLDVGPWQVPGLVLFASVGGIIGYGLRALRARAKGDRSEVRGLPFGPFIAFAVVVG